MEGIISWILAGLLTLSCLGVILARKPVYSGLCFLGTLLTLTCAYLQLSAEFIAVMQILVYAGAILVIFMFVIVLFQDAHEQILKYQAQSLALLLFVAGGAFLLSFVRFGKLLKENTFTGHEVFHGYGTAQSLGLILFQDFFFPFEAIILLFLVAVVGALYIAKRET